MKSTSALLAALAGQHAVLAQPHQHNHAHQHPARLAHEHAHGHDKRVLETEVVIEWVYETVVEMIDGTATEWTTLPPATTFSTSVASAASAGEFHEEPTSPVPVAQPVETYSPAPAVTPSAAEEPEPAPTISEPVPVVVEPTTTSEPAPVVVEPTVLVSEPPAPVAQTTTTAPAAAAPSASSDSGEDTTGWKITWIGDTTGAYSACGQPYEADSMFVAVNPGVLDCGADGMGTSMTITANGKTVSAVAIDKCMGCDPTHIDVATAVYEALGFTLTDGGMHDTGIKWVIS